MMLSMFFIGFVVILLSNDFFRNRYIRTSNKDTPHLLPSIYGTVTIDDFFVLDLLESDGMTRLKNVNQYGILGHLGLHKSFNRYEHSLGVYHLLKHFNRSFTEQISGLLHDISHTAFSHLGDHFFNVYLQDSSYHDTAQASYLMNWTTIPFHLHRYGYLLSDVYINHKNFMIKRDMPDFGFDRLEYTLQGGVVEGLLSLDDVQEILRDLFIQNNQFYFKDPKIARKFADVTLHLTEKIWGSVMDQIGSLLFVRALKYAITTNVITLNDIQISNDVDIMEKLLNANDLAIIDYLIAVYSSEYLYHEDLQNCEEELKKTFYRHFRGVDPRIYLNAKDTFQRLTEIDENYHKRYEKVKNLCENGHVVCVHKKLVEKKIIT